MPQKKRLELKPDDKLQTIKYYTKKVFVFVLDLQAFYEVGSVLKVVLPSGRLKYIPLSKPLKKIHLTRSMGLGYLQGNTFYWVDFYPNPSLTLCISWMIPIARYLRVSVFLVCVLLQTELKRKISSKKLFGLFIYYLLVSIDISGWSLSIHERSLTNFLENPHFLAVCITTVNDLPFINLNELEHAYRGSKKILSEKEEKELYNLTKLSEKEITTTRKIKIIYWILQEASLKKISDKFSITTWATCADLLLYYAQSLRLWIP